MQMLGSIGFVWQGLGRGGAPGVTSLGRCQSHLQGVPAASEVGPPVLLGTIFIRLSSKMTKQLIVTSKLFITKVHQSRKSESQPLKSILGFGIKSQTEVEAAPVKVP